MTTREEGEALLRRIYEECFNAKNPALIDELFASDYTDHQVGQPAQNREQFKQTVAMYIRAFPDFEFTYSGFIMDGDRAAWLSHWTGTHTGELMGIPPTGKRVSMDSVDYGIIRDGKAVEHWTGQDNLALMQQLGVIPAMGAAPAGAGG